VEEIIGGRLRIPKDAKEEGRDFVSIFAPSGETSFEPPISSGPIQWTTEAMVDEANYLAIGGAQSFSFRIEVTRSTFGLRFQAMLNKPISAGTHRCLLDNEVSDLHLLNAKGDLKGFAVQIQTAVFSPQIDLKVEHSIEAHPVLKISNSPDPRPTPRARTAGMGRKNF
jgi:hypothetical protein